MAEKDASEKLELYTLALTVAALLSGKYSGYSVKETVQVCALGAKEIINPTTGRPELR